MSALATIDYTPLPVTLTFRPLIPMDSDQFYEFCQLNSNYLMERTADGEVVITAAVGGESGGRNLQISRRLGNWADSDGTGVAFDSSTGFILSNDAMRAPDGSWVLRSRLANLTPIEKQKFLPLCPDFVVELRLPTDRLSMVKSKMEQYMANGARLGWLIDPLERRVYVYTAGSPTPTILENPAEIQGDPAVMPNFMLDLARIWDPGF